MTANEALYWCEQFENNVVLADPQKEKMVLALQAMKLCKKALEKQIPQKLLCVGIYKVCPVCKNEICMVGDDGRYGNYCDSCGQALAYDDEELPESNKLREMILNASNSQIS